MKPRQDQDERFADWVDGRLPAAERERLEREVESDPDLRQRLEDYRATVDWLRSDPGDERAPAGLVDAVMARVDAEGAASERRWLPVLSSMAAAAAITAIGIFLWNLEGATPKREDSARSGPGDRAARGEVSSTLLVEDDVRFGLPESQPGKSGALAGGDEFRKAGPPGRGGAGSESDESSEASRELTWGDLGSVQPDLAEGLPSSLGLKPAEEGAQQVFHVAQGEEGAGIPPLTEAGPGGRDDAKQKVAADQERLLRKVQELAGSADKGDAPGENMRRVELAERSKEVSPPAEEARTPEPYDRISARLGEDLESQRRRNAGLKAETADSEKDVAWGSLVVLVTVPEPPQLSAAGRLPSEAETRARGLLPGSPRRKSEPAVAPDTALSLVRPAARAYSNALPPMVLEVPPVLLRRVGAPAPEAKVPTGAGVFALATGDRLFVVTGEQAQLGTYFSQLREIVGVQQGRIDLVRTRPGEDFGITGGVQQFVQAQQPVGGFVDRDAKAVLPEDIVLVVVRPGEAPAAAGAEPEASTEAKKR